MDNSAQKRLVLALALAFIFFIAYDHFYLSKIREAQALEANKTALQTQNAAPKVENSNSQSSATPAPTTSVVVKEPIVKIATQKADLSIDELGRINSFVLKEEKYKNDNGEAINLIKADMSPLPLEIRFEDANLNNLAFATPYTATSSNLDATNGSANLVLTQNLGDIVVTKNLTFYPNGNYDIKVNLSKNAVFYISPGSRPSEVIDGYTIHGALVRNADESLAIFEDGDVKSNEVINNANIAAVSDRYYTKFFYTNGNDLNVVLTSKDDITQVFAKSNGEFNAGGYIGPKEYKTLNSIDSKLTNVIEYGWFTFIARPMFKFLSGIYDYIGNWGWAIVILTLIIRLILFPLSYKGMMSMNKLKDLAPKMKELQEKYKNEPQKLQAQMMQLYKKHGANPMGGCLPILLQIPVFFAIYRVLLNAIELKGAPWVLWIQDLSIKDPFFILPITMGILMFLQQKITPTTFSDPMQEKVMKFLPLIFTFLFATFPAGLTLYWTINNIASIVQQYAINKLFDKQKKLAAEKHNEDRS